VKRINVSLDTRDRAKFAELTRRDSLPQVLEGLAAAKAAGIRIKLNAVALKGVNDSEIPEMLRWAGGEGMDLTLIETMPLGDIDGDRTDQYLPLSVVRAQLMDQFTLEDIPYKTGGPARYVTVKETGGRLGFITPMTHNFCESCNRVRLTCTGRLYTCLGREDGADLREALRSDPSGVKLREAILGAIERKPKGHDFDAARLATPASPRNMSTTGG
jgi:cyclic pyranopterin phosphate synthase